MAAAPPSPRVSESGSSWKLLASQWDNLCTQKAERPAPRGVPAFQKLSLLWKVLQTPPLILTDPPLTPARPRPSPQDCLCPWLMHVRPLVHLCFLLVVLLELDVSFKNKHILNPH